MIALLAALAVALPAPDGLPPRCEALYREGRHRYFEGRFAAAREAFSDARACVRVDGGREDTLSWRYEGLCFQYEDRLDDALAAFRGSAAELERQMRAGGWVPPRPSAALADAVNNVGWLLHLKGEDRLARAELDRALQLAPDGVEDRDGAVWVSGRVRANHAVVTAALGDAASAHRELEAVATTPSGDRMGRTRALEHLGRIEESWGDLGGAVARLEEALATGEDALREAAPAPYNRAYLVGVLSRLGLLRERLGRTAGARDALERALEAARTLGTRHLVADVLLDRGRLARDASDLAAALASHEEALALAEAAGLERSRALALAELGWDRLAAGDGSTALELFRRALASPVVADAPEAAASIRSGIARALEMTGRLSSAVDEDDRAAALVDAVRLGELQEARRLGFWRLRQGVFQDAVARRHRLLVDTGDPGHGERALELAEQARSRTLLALIGRGLSSPPPAEGGAWSVARLRAGLLAEDAALVVFSLAEPRSWVWAVTREDCAMATLPGRAEIERAAGAWRRRLASGAPYGRAARDEAARLWKLLLLPVEERFRGRRRLLIAADGVLHLLPFEALEDGAGRTLLERHVVSYAPSASVAGALHQRHASRPRPAGRLLALAEPPSPRLGPLPLSRIEATRIAALFPTGSAVLRLGGEASERWLKRTELTAYGVVHFATHGILDDRAPGRSGLLLAPGGGEDGLVEVREIAALTLRARLVSLSACDSGLGELVTGEGVVGLARAFLDAGADAVAMTLWPVPDASTAELMARFYSGLRAGRSAAEALRGAKLALRAGRPARRPPFHWAGVVLSGDPDASLPEF